MTATMATSSAEVPDVDDTFGLRIARVAAGSTKTTEYKSSVASRMAHTAGAKEVQEAIEGNGIDERRAKVNDNNEPTEEFVVEPSGKLGMTRDGDGGISPSNQS